MTLIYPDTSHFLGYPWARKYPLKVQIPVHGTFRDFFMKSAKFYEILGSAKVIIDVRSATCNFLKEIRGIERVILLTSQIVLSTGKSQKWILLASTWCFYEGHLIKTKYSKTRKNASIQVRVSKRIFTQNPLADRHRNLRFCALFANFDSYKMPFVKTPSVRKKTPLLRLTSR